MPSQKGVIQLLSQEDVKLVLSIKDWLEIGYFLSGILLLIFAGFGLWQLKLTKDQIKTS
ncbi:hypothetical protein AADZ91_18085 [Colwelliaceae bacterium 6441]